MRAGQAVAAGVAMIGVVVALACGSSDNGTPTQPNPQPQPQVGTISGIVADGTGAGVAGVTLTLSAPSKTSLTTTTGADGRYAFQSVAVGSWTLSVSAPAGYTISGQGSQTLSVANGQSASANFNLDKVVQGSGGDTSTVSIVDFGFTPSSITVSAGTTVKWTNTGAARHTVTSDSGSELGSGNLSPNGTYSHTFGAKGTFSYHCAIHPSMVGSVTVQ